MPALNLSPFEAHFGRKVNTHLSNISTETNPNTLTYVPILNKYLDFETMSWDELIPDEQWDEENWSDVVFERQLEKMIKDSRKRCNSDPHKEPRTMPHSGVAGSKKRH